MGPNNRNDAVKVARGATYLYGQALLSSFVSIIYFAQPPIASPDLYLRQVPASLVPSVDLNDPAFFPVPDGLRRREFLLDVPVEFRLRS